MDALARTQLDGIYIVYTGLKYCPRHISTYILANRSDVAIIDPGPKNTHTRVLDALKKMGLMNKNIKIVLTHIHIDHAGSATILSKKLGGSPIYVHPIGVKHLKNPEKLWNASRQVLGWLADEYGSLDSGEDLDIIGLKDNDELLVGDFRLKALYTPGHASHHISYYLEDQNLVFIGDAAGVFHSEVEATYPTTPPPFRYRDYIESIDRIIGIGPKYIAYPHSGIASNISILKKHRDQIELWVELIKQGADTIDVLAEKDPFFAKIYRYYNNGRDLCPVERVIIENSIMGISEEIKRFKSLS